VGPQPSPKAAVHRSGAPSATPHDTEKRYAAADKLPLKDGFEDKFAAFRSVEDACFVTTSYRLLTHDECFA